MKTDRAEKLISNMRKLASKMGELNKMAGILASDGAITFSELSLLMVIGENENIRITELADKHGTTKGTVSKAVKKLVQKSMATKTRLPENEKEVLVSLTPYGREVVNEKNAHLLSFTKTMDKELSRLSENEINAVFKILKLIEDHVDKHLDNK